MRKPIVQKTAIIWCLRRIAAPIIFLCVSLFLTYRIISLPTLVIGDNFYWSQPSVADILGPQIVRQSYLGDVGLLSTFRIGFLFPIVYALNSLKLPITIVYPFGFYVLTMLSFYFLAGEFLTNEYSRIAVSILYLVNPVVPYYFASIMSAFALIFLPLSLKFIVRGLREIPCSLARTNIPLNISLASLMLALSVSAHEQFFLSAMVLASFMLLTLGIWCYRIRSSNYFLKNVLGSTVLFAIVFSAANLPLALSLVNVSGSPLSTYFTGRFADFIANVRYSYAFSLPANLVRLGGDSGVGLGQNSWYDTGPYTNIFGFGLFVALVWAVYLLVVKKSHRDPNRLFFLMCISVFFASLGLIEFVRNLPNDSTLASFFFSAPIQTWETPGKLRVLMLLSLLTTVIVVFRQIEATSIGFLRKRAAKVCLVGLLIGLMIVYNSPWAISYAGLTPLQQISDNLNWGGLYRGDYAQLSNYLTDHYSDSRGVILPYTHESELYSPPNFRLFQLVSPVTQQLTDMAQSGTPPWAKILGVLSAKYVVLNKAYNPNEELIFPKPADQNITKVLDELSGASLVPRQNLGNFSIYQNNDSLPVTYATEQYVLYDNPSTLKYAISETNFESLPVFLPSGAGINQIAVPSFVNSHVYSVNAIVPSTNTSNSNFSLLVTHNGLPAELVLNKTSSISDADVFSAPSTLSPSDTITVPNPDRWNLTRQLDERTLNSTYLTLGTFSSFILNFTASVTRKGQFDFLGPRVLIGAAGSGQYFLIFHTNGVVELANLVGQTLTTLEATNGEFSLDNPSDTIRVGISRVFGRMSVYVNGNEVMEFSTSLSSNISLASEQSITKFSNIEVLTRNVIGLFVSRQTIDKPAFHIQQEGAESSTLTITTKSTDYAIVSQYLFTDMRHIQTTMPSYKTVANLFFEAWILHPENSTSGLPTATVKLSIQNSQADTGVLFFSIAFTYLLMGAASPWLRGKARQYIRRVRKAW